MFTFIVKKKCSALDSVEAAGLFAKNSIGEAVRSGAGEQYALVPGAVGATRSLIEIPRPTYLLL